MLGGGSTILMMSDEGVSAYVPAGGRYRFVHDVYWQDPEFVVNLSDLLSKSCKGRPVKILYDMVEQYYRREMVPKVRVFDQRLVLGRRLAAAFSNYPMRQALALKPPASDPKKGTTDKNVLKDQPYLFAALPEHDLLTKIIEAVRLAMVYVQGIYLLPIESVGLVQKISKVLNDKGADPDRWIVFMSQHRGGGLRQIVVRNGELSLTRQTSVIDTATEHSAWATQVAQEFSATMGYVSRYGYTPDATLEVIVVGHADATDLLQPLVKCNQFYALTPLEAARHAGVAFTPAEQANHAELLHIAWLAKQMKPVLTFQNRELAYMTKARLGSKVVSQILMLGALGALGYAGYQSMNLMEAYNEQSEQRLKLSQVEEDHKKLISEVDKSGINIELVQSSIDVYKSLETNKTDLFTFMRNMRAALTPGMALDKAKFEFVETETPSPDPMSVELLKSQRLNVTLDLSFAAGSRPEIANVAVSDLRDRLTQKFPDFDVAIQTAPIDMTKQAALTVTKGKSPGEGDSRLQAVITMTQKVPAS